MRAIPETVRPPPCPIGCRDRGTLRLFVDHGLPTHLTLCPTLTLPRRDRPPRAGRTFIVDGRKLAIPQVLRKGALELSHVSPTLYSEATKRAMAGELLDAYRTQASLVITTRIHAALPCLAMGIPVIYFGEAGNDRQSIVRNVGIPSHLRNRNAKKGILCGFNEDVDWSGYTAVVTTIADAIHREVAERIEAAEALLASDPPLGPERLPQG